MTLASPFKSWPDRRGDRRIPRGDPAQSRLCRGPRQPRAALRHKESWTRQVAAYREAIRLEPDDADAHFSSASPCRIQLELHGAIAEFREAIRLKPDHVDGPQRPRHALQPQGKRRRGHRRISRGDPAQAGYADAHYDLGVALCNRASSTRLSPNTARRSGSIPILSTPHANLGSALRQQGKLDEAIVEYRELIRLEPGNAGAHCELGFGLGHQGKFREALAELEKATK